VHEWQSLPVAAHSAGVWRYGDGVEIKNHGRKTHGLTGPHNYYSFHEDDRHVPALQNSGGTHAASSGTRA